MQVEEFERKLKAANGNKGGAFVKADFHIHSPISSDYEYKATDSVEQLGRVLQEQGYRYAVILEHQKMPDKSFLADLNKYCPSTLLIPGAEINIFVDTLFKKVAKDYYFHCIVAIDPAQSRDYSFILETAKKKFTYKDSRRLSCWIYIKHYRYWPFLYGRRCHIYSGSPTPVKTS